MKVGQKHELQSNWQSFVLLRCSLCTWVFGILPGCFGAEMDLRRKIRLLIPARRETGLIYFLLPLQRCPPPDKAHETRWVCHVGSDVNTVLSSGLPLNQALKIRWTTEQAAADADCNWETSPMCQEDWKDKSEAEMMKPKKPVCA